jgi:hypothetical protein
MSVLILRSKARTGSSNHRAVRNLRAVPFRQANIAQMWKFELRWKVCYDQDCSQYYLPLVLHH